MDRSVQLSRNLAEEVVSANRPRVLLGIATQFVDAVRAVRTGQVPAAPAPPAACTACCAGGSRCAQAACCPLELHPKTSSQIGEVGSGSRTATLRTRLDNPSRTVRPRSRRRQGDSDFHALSAPLGVGSAKWRCWPAVIRARTLSTMDRQCRLYLETCHRRRDVSGAWVTAMWPRPRVHGAAANGRTGCCGAVIERAAREAPLKVAGCRPIPQGQRPVSARLLTLNPRRSTVPSWPKDNRGECSQ